MQTVLSGNVGMFFMSKHFRIRSFLALQYRLESGVVVIVWLAPSVGSIYLIWLKPLRV